MIVITEPLVSFLITVQRITDKHVPLIPTIPTGIFLPKIIQAMQSSHSCTYSIAVRCISSILATEDASVIDKALLEGVVQSFYTNLFRQELEVIKEALWGLSNLCCSADNHISYVLENEDLVLRLIGLMSHPAYKIVCESTWVITNALTSCSPETLFKFTVKYFGTLVEPLANSINLV